MNEHFKDDSAELSKHDDGEGSDISRRTVILTIGHVAIGFGLSSSVLGDAKAPPQLPPGLYQPSTDHLGHALMFSGHFHPIPSGCPTDYIRPRIESFTPLFFSPTEFALVRRMTQLILGEAPINGGNENATTTQEVAEWIDQRVASAHGVREAARHLEPLYRVLAVAYFGSPQVIQLETATPEKICREGLEWLSNATKSRGFDHFLRLTEEEQIDILNSISDERWDKQSENAGTRLFAFLKAEVIRGYYTSEAGLKELDFKGNSFYARSPGCESQARNE